MGRDRPSLHRREGDIESFSYANGVAVQTGRRPRSLSHPPFAPSCPARTPCFPSQLGWEMICCSVYYRAQIERIARDLRQIFSRPERGAVITIPVATGAVNTRWGRLPLLPDSAFTEWKLLRHSTRSRTCLEYRMYGRRGRRLSAGSDWRSRPEGIRPGLPQLGWPNSGAAGKILAVWIPTGQPL